MLSLSHVINTKLLKAVILNTVPSRLLGNFIPICLLDLFELAHQAGRRTGGKATDGSRIDYRTTGLLSFAQRDSIIEAEVYIKIVLKGTL